jgi:hypothetical protein
MHAHRVVWTYHLATSARHARRLADALIITRPYCKGCRLTRDPLSAIEAAGFGEVASRHFVAGAAEGMGLHSFRLELNLSNSSTHS